MIDLCVAASAASLACIAGSASRRSPRAWIPSVIMTIGMIVASIEAIPSTVVLLVAAINIFVAAPLAVYRSDRSTPVTAMHLHRALSSILMGGLLIARSTSGGVAHTGMPTFWEHQHAIAPLGVMVICAVGYLIFSGWLASRTVRTHRGRVGIFTIGDISAMTAAVVAMAVMA